MTASELQDLIVDALARSAGGSRRRWRIVVGPVRLPKPPPKDCNWSVDPRGGAREVDEVQRLLERLRRSHQLVTPD